MIELPVQSKIRAVEKRGGIKMSWSHPVPRNPKALGEVLRTVGFLFLWVVIQIASISLLAKEISRLSREEPPALILPEFNVEELPIPLLIGAILILFLFLGGFLGLTLGGIRSIVRLLAYLKPSIKTEITLSPKKNQYPGNCGMDTPCDGQGLLPL
jgi:hypothetical protein